MSNLKVIYKKIWTMKKMYFVNTFMLILVQAALPFIPIWTLKYVVDELTGEKRSSVAGSYILIMVISLLVLQSLNCLFTAFDDKMYEKLKFCFIQELQEKTLNMSCEQIEDSKLIRIQQKAMEIFYPKQAQFMNLKNVTGSIRIIIADFLSLAGLGYIFLSLSFWVFVLILVVTMITARLSAIAKSKEHEVWDQSLVAIGQRLGYYQEIATSNQYAKEMRINQLGSWVCHKMEQLTKDCFTETRKAVRAFIGTTLISNVLNIMLEGGLYLYFVWLMYHGTIGFGDFTLYSTGVLTFATMLVGMFSQSVIVLKSSEYIDNYVTYMNTSVEDKKDTHNIGKMEEGSCSFRFEDVWFCYPGQSEYTIRGINLSIQPEEKIAIVGDNGAGKTTLISLIMRLYKPQKGTIYMNGVDIETIDYSEYHKKIAAVFQNVEIFEFSLLENIVMGSKEVNKTKFEEVLLQTELGELVEKLPKKENTMMWKRFDKEGVELSGGQQQKLAMARALYKESGLIILDEPTAMLSPKAEYDLYMKYNNLVKGKTSIFISHRMSSCIFCDRIFVLEHGKVVESGSHQQLMEQKGKYFTMFETQAKFYKEE